MTDGVVDVVRRRRLIIRHYSIETSFGNGLVQQIVSQWI